MARDECNQETRIGSETFDTELEAYAQLDKVRSEYEEYRSLWVEMNMEEYYKQEAMRLYEEEQDLY